MGQLSLLIVFTRRYIELQSITAFVEFVDLLGCTHFYFFFFQITRNKKVPVSAPLLFFFGTLYCSNYYSIKSKPVPVVITVVNNNIAEGSTHPAILRLTLIVEMNPLGRTVHFWICCLREQHGRLRQFCIFLSAGKMKH